MNIKYPWTVALPRFFEVASLCAFPFVLISGHQLQILSSTLKTKVYTFGGLRCCSLKMSMKFYLFWLLRLSSCKSDWCAVCLEAQPVFKHVIFSPPRCQNYSPAHTPVPNLALLTFIMRKITLHWWLVYESPAYLYSVFWLHLFTIEPFNSCYHPIAHLFQFNLQLSELNKTAVHFYKQFIRLTYTVIILLAFSFSCSICHLQNTSIVNFTQKRDEMMWFIKIEILKFGL